MTDLWNLYVNCLKQRFSDKLMKKILKYIFVGICGAALAACIVIAFTAGVSSRKSLRCTGLQVTILDSSRNTFVSRKDVKGYLDKLT